MGSSPASALREWHRRRAARRTAETVVDLIESSAMESGAYGDWLLGADGRLHVSDDEAMRWAKAREHELRTRALGAAMKSGDYGDWLLDDALDAQAPSADGVIRGPEGFEMLATPAGRYAADLTDPVANAQAAARYLHE